MNRSNTTPRSFSPDQLHAALGDVGGSARSDYLADIVEHAGRTRQRPAWTFLESWLPMDIAVRRQGVPRAAVLFAVLSLLVALLAAGLVYVGSQTTQPERPLGLPTTPDAWQRVVINSDTEGRVEAVAAGPRGLLAAVGEGDESRLFFSADGRDWAAVAADQHGPVGHNGAALVATDKGFLLVGNEVLASEDGLSWRRIAGPAEDPDLRVGTRIAATTGGPGFVAVGSDNKAWYSTDGTDWSLADVPPPPGQPSLLERPLDQTQTQGAFEMWGVAVAGRNLVAWGASRWVHDDNSQTFVPVLWASSDGVSWANVPVPQSTHYATVAGGPNGFVVEDSSDVWLTGDVWLSADGRSWEHVAEAAFGSSRWPALQNDDGVRVEMHLRSIAAGPAGYIAVGADGVCMLRCPSEETVIWTSPDGRSWSRLPNDGRFRAPTGAGANVAAAWESHFVVGGSYDGRPAIWISGSEQSGSAANAGTPSPTPSSAPTPSSSPSIQDIWGFEPLGPIEPGAYFIDPDLDPSTPLRVVYEVPAQGWSMWVGGAKFSDAGHVGVSISNVVNLVSDGCRDHMWADPSVGPSVDDLAAALADLAPFQVTSPPVDVTAYGYSGKHLELTVPDLPVEGAGDNQRFTGCMGGKLKSWVAPFDTALGDAFYGYTGPGYVEEFWILDVEGTRLMIAAEQSPGSPPEDVAQLRTILDSIRIEP